MSVEVAHLLLESDAELEIQVPFIAKHPPVKLKPTFEVEVAEPETVRPESVVVPKPVAEIRSAVVEAEVTASNILPVVSPHAVRRAYGVLVPTPSFPSAVGAADWSSLL